MTKPVVLSASSTGSLDTVNIAFSEELDPASAITLANYSISPSLSVTAATYKKKVVTLTTAKQTAGGTAYTVTVNGVKDTSKNAVAVDSKVSFFSYLLSKTGALRFAAWTGVAGNAVQGLFDDPRYPVTPDITGAAFSFNSREVLPTDSLEAYGAVLEGFVTPTESGNYDFFLKSDDASQLSISTDEKESNLAVVAEELGCCGPFEEVGAPETTGTPIPLVAGKKYYVRAIYKEGGGGDYVQVAWKKTTDTTKPAALQPIPTQFLSSAVDVSSPAEGAFRTMTPAANAKGVAPSTKVIIVHRDGKTEWTKANVSLKIDGTLVSPTVTKVGATLTLEYSPSALLASGSVHTIDLGYSDPGGKPTTLTWSFTVQTWSGPTRDKVGSYPAIITGASGYTADKGGATGKAGDYGMDLTKKGGAIVSLDATFLTAANAAAGKDEMSVAFWAKKYDIADTSAFVLRSPSSGNQRAFHAHVPWSNGHIYFDTGDPAGCCDGTRNRIEADIATFPDYTGAAGDITWWTTKWHLFAFTKKADSKQIWIDGKLFLEGNNTGVLATDINAFLIGADGDGGGLYHAIVDDFSVYSTKLVEADVLALTKGTLPTALGASKGLIGYWDFNDAGAVVVVPPKLSIGAGAAGKAVLTFEGTLQASDKVSGPFGDAAGASPLTIDAAGAAKFYRAIRK